MGRRLLACITRSINTLVVSFHPVKKWCVQELDSFFIHGCYDFEKRRRLRTHIDQAVAVPALGSGQFAVGLAQTLPPGTVATRRDVLGSLRLH